MLPADELELPQGGGEDEVPFEADLDDLELEEDEVEVDEVDEELEGEDLDETEELDAEDGEEASPKAKKKAKSTAEADEDEDTPKFPDTPVPTPKAMLSALQWAFDGEENVPDGLLERYAEHARLLLQTNRELNLVAVVQPKEVAAKLYLDSWRLTRLLPLMAKTVVDLGSGGGFPGIPLALAEPMLSIVLCDARPKKAAFLERAVAELGLRNTRVVAEKAEEWLAREKVNMVLVRNVSSVRENIRTLRKVRHNLRDFVMIKGTSWSRELRAAEREAERLGFRLDTVWEHDLPEEMGHRVVLVYRAPGGMGN
ncbi:MAG TPA: 16S rRNA (guanine(527)-N(7))-methyltransferase RsmG [Planctomycetota bacterium]|nr:16S rRNA (guanine(527)-N(7))-methyltransferase RsmG [Planctomycetota bacterium]